MSEAARKIEEKPEGTKKNGWWKLVIIGLISLALMFGLFSAGVSLLGEERYSKYASIVNESLGLPGIFLYVYIVDTLILPLSPDLVYPVVASMNPFVIIPLIGSASALGGLTSYGVGRLLFHIPFIRRLIGKAYAKWGAYITKYGFTFVLAAGILPLPFSTICIAAGAMKMDFRKILICCSMRYIRTALYFMLFRAGLIAFA